MYIPISWLVGAAFGIVLLVWLLRRPRARDRDLLQPPRTPEAAPGAASAGLPPALEAEVRQLVRDRRKIEAIKRVREETRLGLAEAKDLVERL